jgi:type VI secretion system protein ImpL
VLFGNRDNANAAPAAATAQTPEQRVTEHYAPIIELAQPLEKGGKTIVFDDFLKQVDELYRYLTAVQDAANSGMPAPGGEAISRLQASAGRLPGGLQSMFSNMAVGASSDTQSRELENVRKRISVEVGGFCRQAIAGRYPLVRNASSEVTPDDLARMFAPGTGLMDSFFRDNLTSKVDTTQSPWRFMPGIDGKTLPGSEGLLAPFQQAQSIRDAFLPGKHDALLSCDGAYREHGQRDFEPHAGCGWADSPLQPRSTGGATGELARAGRNQPGTDAAWADERHHLDAGDQWSMGAEPLC